MTLFIGLIQGFGVLLLAVVFIGSLLAVAIDLFEPNGGKRYSVGPLVLFLLSSMALTFTYYQLTDLALILSRIGELQGPAGSVAQAHIAGFVAVALILSARAYFVVSELDAGRYLGGRELSGFLAQKRALGVLEAVLRFLIVLALVLFTTSFVRVMIPLSSSDWQITGANHVLVDLHRRCSEYHDIISQQNFDTSKSRCLQGLILEMNEQDLLDRADILMRPISVFLLFAFILMLIWSLVVRISIQRADGALLSLRGNLNLQIIISFLAVLNVVVMIVWYRLASIPVGDEAVNQAVWPQISLDRQAGMLEVLSYFGCCFAVFVIVATTFRLFADTHTTVRLFNAAFPKRGQDSDPNS